MELKELTKDKVIGKRVFLRADLDVPMEREEISDETRLSAWQETLDFLLENQSKVVIAGHLGRPDGIEKKYSLIVIAKWLAKRLDLPISETTIGSFPGWKIGEKISLLENLRFYPEEEKNDQAFSKQLASLAEIFVNDAFSASHREHASIVGVASLLPSYPGFALKKEIETLTSLLESPKRPLVVVIGGAKIETKLPLVEKMHHFADYVLVGGEIAEQDKVLLKIQHEKKEGRISALIVADLRVDGFDITEKSAENFVQIINTAQTVIWNGPMGKIEDEGAREGTRKIAEGIIASNVYSVVGGGDSLAFFSKEGMKDKFSFVSMGGGAMLELLSGEVLPGIKPLLSQSN